MSDGNLVKLDLTKPATVLVEKIASATNILYEPIRIKKKAEADAEAKIILKKADIKATALERRAMVRLIREEADKQRNIETVIEKALPQLHKSAKPNSVSSDWITNLFEKARLTSSEEIQDLWARVLAGESNNPGSYSRRTINLIADLESEDAKLFNILSSYVWHIDGKKPYALVYKVDDEIYSKNGLSFAVLNHFNALGLLTFNNLMVYNATWQYAEGADSSKTLSAMLTYQNRPFILKFQAGQPTRLEVGKVLLTKQGQELVKLCSPKPIKGFVEYIKDHIDKQSVINELIALPAISDRK